MSEKKSKELRRAIIAKFGKCPKYLYRRVKKDIRNLKA